MRLAFVPFLFFCLLLSSSYAVFPNGTCPGAFPSYTNIATTPVSYIAWGGSTYFAFGDYEVLPTAYNVLLGRYSPNSPTVVTTTMSNVPTNHHPYVYTPVLIAWQAPTDPNPCAYFTTIDNSNNAWLTNGYNFVTGATSTSSPIALNMNPQLSPENYSPNAAINMAVWHNNLVLVGSGNSQGTNYITMMMVSSVSPTFISSQPINIGGSRYTNVGGGASVLVDSTSTIYVAFASQTDNNQIYMTSCFIDCQTVAQWLPAVLILASRSADVPRLYMGGTYFPNAWLVVLYFNAGKVYLSQSATSNPYAFSTQVSNLFYGTTPAIQSTPSCLFQDAFSNNYICVYANNSPLGNSAKVYYCGL